MFRLQCTIFSSCCGKNAEAAENVILFFHICQRFFNALSHTGSELHVQHTTLNFSIPACINLAVASIYKTG
jgi:hypothetical protein